MKDILSCFHNRVLLAIMLLEMAVFAQIVVCFYIVCIDGSPLEVDCASVLVLALVMGGLHFLKPRDCDLDENS